MTTTTTTTDEDNNNQKKIEKVEEGEKEKVTASSSPLLIMKEEEEKEDSNNNKKTTNDAVASSSAVIPDDNNNRDKKKKNLMITKKGTTKSIIQNTHKGIQKATKTTQKGIQHVTKTTKHGIQQVVTKTVDVSTPLLGGKSKSKQQQQQEPIIKSYDAVTTTSARVVVEEGSKNLAMKASPVDVKSSITLEEGGRKATTVSTSTNNNIYNNTQQQPQITTTTMQHDETNNSLLFKTTIPSYEVIPRLLTIIIGVILTFNLYWDAILNQGQVPVYLIPLWFILGIFVNQLFLVVRPVIHVIPTNTTTTGETTTTGRGGVETTVDEFARRTSPRRSKGMLLLTRNETPIDEPSVELESSRPTLLQQTKSTTTRRRDFFFKFLRVDKMFSKQRSDIIMVGGTTTSNCSSAVKTRTNEASIQQQQQRQHQFHIVSTSDFTKYFTNLGSNNNKNHNHDNNKKQHNNKKNVLWNNMAENNGELMDYLFLNFTDFSKKKKKKKKTMNKQQQQEEEDEDDIDTTTSTTAAEAKGTDDHHDDDEESTPRPGKAEEEEESVVVVDEEEPSMMAKGKDVKTTIDTNTTMGHVSNDNMRAHKLEKDMVIDPLFTLRGIDVFRPNGPAEEKIWRQPILEDNGLFDVPTFVVNVMLPWYNFVLYFQMPDWVKKFNDITEHPDDTEDTKALKRFLKGNAEYRDPRWKIVPCLVNGPFVIRAIAPVKTAIKICRQERLPVSWHQYDEQICPKTGQLTRCALLEADCDLCSDPAIRKILGIVKGQVPRVTIDCAMIIDKPYGSKIPEPSACMGLWRIDKINLDEAAIIPEKDERQLLQEFITILPEGNELSKSIRNLLEKQKKKKDHNNEGGLSAVITAPGITVQA